MDNFFPCLAVSSPNHIKILFIIILNTHSSLQQIAGFTHLNQTFKTVMRLMNTGCLFHTTRCKPAIALAKDTVLLSNQDNSSTFLCCYPTHK